MNLLTTLIQITMFIFEANKYYALLYWLNKCRTITLSAMHVVCLGKIPYHTIRKISLAVVFTASCENYFTLLVKKKSFSMISLFKTISLLYSTSFNSEIIFHIWPVVPAQDLSKSFSSSPKFL